MGAIGEVRSRLCTARAIRFGLLHRLLGSDFKSARISLRVLLVEDDYLIAREIEDELKARYAGIEIVDVGTEASFDESFPRFESEPLDLVILDIMLAEPVPQDSIERHRGLRGGLRCLQRLRANPNLSNIPVILHTALDWIDLEPELRDKPAHVLYAKKAATLEQLFVQIRALLLALDKLPRGGLATVLNGVQEAVVTQPSTTTWDVFISYASEDRAAVALPLAKALQNSGLAVWYDEFELHVGDSLTRTIDAGLAKSHFGVVVLSQQFFAKEWPRKELDALLSRESDGTKVVLPVWHSVDAKAVAAHSAILASRYAARTDDGLDSVVRRLLDSIGRAPVGLLTGLWAGRTGRMRLEQNGNQVNGDYDWKVAEWVGHLEGTVRAGVFRYQWRWDRTEEHGQGYFVIDSTRDALNGEWFYGDEAVDIDAAIKAARWQGKHAWSFIRVPRNVEHL